MSEKKSNSTRFWQIAGVIVGLISISWGIYANVQRKYQKEIDAATILRLTEKVFGLQREINIHIKNDAAYKIRFDSLALIQQKDRETSLRHKGLADAYRLHAEQLQTKLNEKVIINATDDEHIRMFIGWANLSANSPDAH